jgi:putative transposase
MAIRSRAPLSVEVKADARWSVDLVHNRLSDGRRFRIFKVIDVVTKESLAALADGSAGSTGTRRHRSHVKASRA